MMEQLCFLSMAAIWCLCTARERLFMLSFLLIYLAKIQSTSYFFVDSMDKHRERDEKLTLLHRQVTHVENSARQGLGPGIQYTSIELLI